MPEPVQIIVNNAPQAVRTIIVTERVMEVSGGGGTGDVVGPASAVDNHFASFDGTSGKLIQDSGYGQTDFASAAQGALATSALQPGDNITELVNNVPYATVGDAPTVHADSHVTGGSDKIRDATASQDGLMTAAYAGLLDNQSGTNTGDQNLFSTIAVSGQSNVVADSTSDTLTLVAGTNVTITTDASTDTITIAATGGGGSGDVVGPASSVDSQVAVFDSTTGKLIKASTATGVAKVASGVLTAGNVNLTSEVTGTLPVANGGTGITSLGAGVPTFLGTPSSANLRAALTDETGTGAAVFANTPTLVTPDLGDATGMSISLAGGAARLNAQNIVSNDAAALHNVFGLNIANNLGIGFSSDATWFAAPDVILKSDGAAKLALRNGANAQEVRVYETYTDASNYERLSISAASGTNVIKPEAAGTGTASVVEYHTTSGGVRLMSGSGSPEGVVSAPIGTIYQRTDGGTNTSGYLKESGTGNTGWVAISNASGSGDVTGPASATDEALARFDSTTGKVIQNSVITATDAGIVAGVTQLNVDNLRLDGNTLSSTDTNGNIALAPNGTGVVTVAQLQATGSAGLDLHNSSGTPIILIGAGGGVNASINAPANVGSNLADYHQFAGGSGTITDTAAGSSTNISINLVPKGTGRLQAGGVDVPTISSTDTLTNKTLTSPTLTTPTISGAITFPDDVRQTFNPGSTNAGLNVGAIAGDPSSPSNGDLWYDSTSNQTKYRNNGSTLLVAAVELMFAVSDETTALTTGTAKLTFRMPHAMTLTSVRASVGTAPTGSTLIVDINESGSTILSTKLSIDAGEKTSTTAATPPVISDTALADDAEITIDIDQIGSTIAGAGLKVTLIGTRA